MHRINDGYNQGEQRLMSIQYLEATYRPNINSFTGEYAEAVKRFQIGNRVEKDHIQK